MTPDALRAELSRLGLTEKQAELVLGVKARTIRRWKAGEWPVSQSVSLLLPKLTKAEVEKILKKKAGGSNRLLQTKG